MLFIFFFYFCTDCWDVLDNCICYRSEIWCIKSDQISLIWCKIWVLNSHTLYDTFAGRPMQTLKWIGQVSVLSLAVLPDRLFCVHRWKEAKVSAPPAALCAGNQGLLSLADVPPPEHGDGFDWVLIQFKGIPEDNNQKTYKAHVDLGSRKVCVFLFTGQKFQPYLVVFLSCQPGHFCLYLHTCSFPPSASVKEVSSDARALGIRAEMNSRRCWEAALESGSGKEPREPTKLREGKENFMHENGSATMKSCHCFQWIMSLYLLRTHVSEKELDTLP